MKSIAIATTGPLPVPTGIHPDCYYDSDDFCAILRIAEKRRLKLAARLRRHPEAIANGHSFVAPGRVMLESLRSATSKEG